MPPWEITPGPPPSTPRARQYCEVYFYNARYSDPTLGRSISADVIAPNPATPQALMQISCPTRTKPVFLVETGGGTTSR